MSPAEETGVPTKLDVTPLTATEFLLVRSQRKRVYWKLAFHGSPLSQAAT